MSADTPKLRHKYHVVYFLRCLKTLLPHHYTSSDSSRAMFAFFTLAGLDLLGVLDDEIDKMDGNARAGYIDWLYSLQHPDGGFRGFTGTILPSTGSPAGVSDEVAGWDVATVPSTYFVLLSLVLLGDDLGRVDREQTLGWLRKLQQSDGGFVEMAVRLDRDRTSTDPRFAHTAAAVRWILNGDGCRDRSLDFDVSGLIRSLERLQTFDGGVSNRPGHESHAGFGYCASNALSLVNDLSAPAEWSHPTQLDQKLLIRWTVHRLTTHFTVPSTDDNDSDDDTPPMPEFFAPLPRAAGFSGRTNKVADTCYAFWALATLASLSKAGIVEMEPVRRFLLVGTQSDYGGFSKVVDSSIPDIYHSYLGLAAMSIVAESDSHAAGSVTLKPIEPALCVSRHVVDRLRLIRARFATEAI